MGDWFKLEWGACILSLGRVRRDGVQREGRMVVGRCRAERYRERESGIPLKGVVSGGGNRVLFDYVLWSAECSSLCCPLCF